MLFDAFCGPSYLSNSPIITSDDAYNLYCQQVESNTGKSHFSLLSVPGTRSFATVAGGPLRAMAYSEQGPGIDEVLVVIAGPNVYKIDSTGASTLLGTVAFTGGGQVIPAQIIPCQVPTLLQAAFILSEGQGYIADFVANTITPVTLPVSFASTATYLDTYIIISNVDSRDFYISAVGDPTSWNPLDVATKEAAPDFLQGVFAANELLFLFGLETTEIWYDSGAANFPFTRYPGGGVWESGTVDPYSICKVGDAVIWTQRSARGQNAVYMARGLQFQRISNHAVEVLLQGAASVGSAAGVAYTYEENGHFFYVLNTSTAPGGLDITIVYDMTTNMWHKRGLWDGTNYHRQPWQYCQFAFYAPSNSQATCHYVGGTGVGTDTTAIIYQMNMALYDFDGAAKRCMRVSPHLTGEMTRTRYNNVILDLDRSSSPVLDLQTSNNGGKTFGVVHTITANPTAADGQARAIWRNLGSGRDKVIMISSQTPCLQAWAACYVNEARAAA